MDSPARSGSVRPMARSLTEELRAQTPTLHGEAEYWGLAWPALAWLEQNVQPGMATLETGAGSSTIVFAARGAEHEAVTPSAEEAERIRAQCDRRGISTANLQFRLGPSHEVLPGWEPRPLDLVLVDGAHGFPYPILDWWWLAPHVRIGGRMLLDDAYMPPVAMLVDHLRRSRAWEVVGSVGYRTVVVRKLAEGLPDFDWHGERLGGRMSFRYLPPAERALSAVRHRVFSTGAGVAAVRWWVRRRSAG
jgi:Methyltransferase domain